MSKAVAIYLFSFLFIANLDLSFFSILKPVIIWGLSPTIALYVFVVKYNKLKSIPLEFILYSSLLVFSLFAFFVIRDSNGFFRYYRVIFSNAILMITVFLAIENPKDLKNIMYSLFFSCFFIILFSFLFTDPQAEEEYYRLTGILGKANGTAIMARIGMMVTILIVMLKFSPKNPILNILLYFVFGLFYYTIILTASRANFVISSLIFPFLFLGSSKFRLTQKFILTVSFLLFVVLILSDYLKEFYIYDRFLSSDGDLKAVEKENRFKYFVLSLETFIKYPIIGIGLNQFRYLSGGKIAHTDILDIATQVGIFGLLGYGGMYYKLFRRIMKNIRSFKGKLKSLNLWLLFFLGSELLFGFFGTNWFLQIHMIFFTILVSATIMIRNKPIFFFNQMSNMKSNNR